MSSWLKKILEWLKGAFFNKELEISIVGLQNAGKSTLVNSLATGSFEEDTIPTIGFNHR
jgi:GTPase SAR1 family protein